VQKVFPYTLPVSHNTSVTDDGRTTPRQQLNRYLLCDWLKNSTNYVISKFIQISSDVPQQNLSLSSNHKQFYIPVFSPTISKRRAKVMGIIKMIIQVYKIILNVTYCTSYLQTSWFSSMHFVLTNSNPTTLCTFLWPVGKIILILTSVATQLWKSLTIFLNHSCCRVSVLLRVRVYSLL